MERHAPQFWNEASGNTLQENQFFVRSATHSKELGAKDVKERLLNGILTFCAQFPTKNIIVWYLFNTWGTYFATYRVKFQNKFLRKHTQSPEDAKIFSQVILSEAGRHQGTCGLACGHWPKLDYFSLIWGVYKVGIHNRKSFPVKQHVCVCLYVFMCVHRCVYLYVCIHTRMYIYVCVSMCVIFVYAFVCVCMCSFDIFLYVCCCIIYVCSSAYIHKCSYGFLFVYMCVHFVSTLIAVARKQVQNIYLLAGLP